MPWVTFSHDFDFYPAARKGRVAVAYKAGMKVNVTRECVTAADDAGVLVREETHEDQESRPLQEEAPPAA